ncbi:MAG: STAS domain-containing protein [Actinoplanes sp.]
MPSETAGIFQDVDPCLTVTARLLPGDDRCAHVRLAGELDLSTSRTLAQTLDWLISVAPTSVQVDLGELTFVGATLPNFVVGISHAMPAGAELVLRRARPMTEWVLRVTGMADIATIRSQG